MCNSSRTGEQSKKHSASKNSSKSSKKIDEKKKSSVNYNKDESDVSDLDDYDSMAAVSNSEEFRSNRPPYIQKIEINSIPVEMCIDTGCPISIIPESIWLAAGKPELSPSPNKLKSYTGNKLNILGEFRGKVTINGSTQVMAVTVCRGNGASLLGRDWLETRRIDWRSVVLAVDGPNLPPQLRPFKNLFNPELGRINSVRVKINVKEGAIPKFFRPRPVPYALHQRVKSELDKLEKDGVIKKATHSEWAAPVVIVSKPDGGIRICGDYKVTINPVLQIDQYPLPRAEDIFSSLQGSRYFTKIDLSRAYLQMPLDEDSQKYTTINTLQGLYQYTRLPFGVACAPAKFQKFMENLLRDVPYSNCYLDDVLIYGGNSVEDHWNRVRSVLKKFEESNIRLHLKKSLFAVSEVEHLGHILSKDGVKPSPKKVNAIVNAPEPKNVSELRSFLGLVTYYCKFIPCLSTIAHPLNRLLHKNQPWKWGSVEKQTWCKLKKCLTSEKVLTHYSLNLPLRLACDASSFGLGAVLSHILPDGSERPVAFASRTLGPAEKNYSQLDKEALSIVFGVRRFHQFIYGRRFSLITDHKPLLAILGPNSGIPALAAARMQRWALILSAYTYDLEFRPTEEHLNADALSRCPLPDFPSARSSEFCYSMGLFSELPITFKEIRAETLKDRLLSSVIDRLKNGWKPSNSCSDLAPFSKKRLEMTIEKDVILWGKRVIVPVSLRPKIISLLHSEHNGISRMKSVARSYVWWPGIDDQLEQCAKDCNPCQQKRNQPAKVVGAKWPAPKDPWHRIHVDFAGPIGNVNLLIVVDASTKWPEVKVLKRITSASTIEVLRTICSDRGVPRIIVTDNGTQFSSSSFKDFVTRNGIKHYMGAPYHPSTNGQVERMVQTVKKYLFKQKSQPGTLKSKIARFLLSYRNTPHPETGRSPAFLMTGRPLRSMFDLLKPDPSLSYPKSLPIVKFDIGQQVLVRDFSSLGEKWLQGTIVNRLGAYLFLVQVGDNFIKRHVDQMLLNSDSSLQNPPSVEESHPKDPLVNPYYAPMSLPNSELSVHPPSTRENMIPVPDIIDLESDTTIQSPPADNSVKEELQSQQGIQSSPLKSSGPSTPAVVPELRRSSRISKRPSHLNDYVMTV